MALIAVLALLATLVWGVHRYVSLDELVVQEQRVRQSIDQRPWQSLLIGLTFYAVVSLIPGTSGKSIVFGWLFGFWRGVVVILLGLTAAAMAIFGLSRCLFREGIERRYGRFLGALNRHLSKEGAFYLLTLRMAHFPYSILNLASGASRVSVPTFFWTTLVGLMPGTMVFAYVGMRLPTLETLATQGAGSLIDASLIAALTLCALLPWGIRWCARKSGMLGDVAGGVEPLNPEDPSLPSP